MGVKPTSIKNNLRSTQVGLLSLFHVLLLPFVIEFKTTMKFRSACLQQINVYRQIFTAYQLYSMCYSQFFNTLSKKASKNIYRVPLLTQEIAGAVVCHCFRKGVF